LRQHSDTHKVLESSLRESCKVCPYFVPLCLCLLKRGRGEKAKVALCKRLEIFISQTTFYSGVYCVFKGAVTRLYTARLAQTQKLPIRQFLTRCTLWAGACGAPSTDHCIYTVHGLRCAVASKPISRRGTYYQQCCSRIPELPTRGCY
jgi:hypothetical protein